MLWNLIARPRARPRGEKSGSEESEKEETERLPSEWLPLLLRAPVGFRGEFGQGLKGFLNRLDFGLLVLHEVLGAQAGRHEHCLLYTSDAADEL